MSSSSLPNKGIPLARICDEDLKKKSPAELSRLVRQLDTENKTLMYDHDNMMKEINRRLQIHLMEIRGLKSVNQKLQDDNQELRDLCCFLDDERQSGKKMAKDWQRFGRYTASVMRSEVSAYQEKLKELEQKQEELIRDNLELQELCLYLGKEHLFDQDRDEGDGSSNGTIAGSEKREPVVETQQQQSAISSETLNYIKHLEDKVWKLEEEKNNLAKQLERRSTVVEQEGRYSTSSIVSSPGYSVPVRAQVVSSHVRPPHCIESIPTPSASALQQHSSKPEAVVHAMKVLEVHQQLERSLNGLGSDHLADNEKAIVKEMCNVVWRKLEDSSPSEPSRINPRSSLSPENHTRIIPPSSLSQENHARIIPPSLENHAKMISSSSLSPENHTRIIPSSSLSPENHSRIIPSSSLSPENHARIIPSSSLSPENHTRIIPSSSLSPENHTRIIPSSSLSPENHTRIIPSSSLSPENHTRIIPPSSLSQENHARIIPPSLENHAKMISSSSLSPENQTRIIPPSSLPPENRAKYPQQTSRGHLIPRSSYPAQFHVPTQQKPSKPYSPPTVPTSAQASSSHLTKQYHQQHHHPSSSYSQNFQPYSQPTYQKTKNKARFEKL